MDEELKQLAALALRNAFWHDFSALANKYLEAAAGLDIATQEGQMSELTSIYGRDYKVCDTNIDLDIWTSGHDNFVRYIVKDHTTILEALKRKDAESVNLRGMKVFEKRDGSWYFKEIK